MFGPPAKNEVTFKMQLYENRKEDKKASFVAGQYNEMFLQQSKAAKTELTIHLQKQKLY